MSAHRGSSPDAVKSEKYQVPLFTEVENGATQFGAAHQYIMQYLLKYGQVPQKRFYIAYIDYFVTMILDKDTSVVAKIQADLPQLVKLTSTVVEMCNEKSHKIGIQIVQSKRETDGQQVISVITQKGYSAAMANRYGVSHDERVFISRIVSGFAESNGQISGDAMFDVGKAIPNLNSAKKDKMLAKLVDHNWISEKNDVYYLEPRAIAEFDPLLRAKYQIPTCVFCQSLIVNRTNVGSCEDCHVCAHHFCIEKMSKDNAAVDCPLSCGNKMTMTEQSRPGSRHVQQTEPEETDSDDGRPGPSTRKRRIRNSIKNEDD